jgi:hypothetical protein
MATKSNGFTLTANGDSKWHPLGQERIATGFFPAAMKKLVLSFFASHFSMFEHRMEYYLL